MMQKKLRIIRYDPAIVNTKRDFKYVNGALLSQSKDDRLFDKLDVVTKSSYDTEAHKALVAFGLHAVRQVKSNAIVAVRETGGYFQLLGIGTGQPNRVNSVRLALDKTKLNLSNEGTGDLENVIVFSDAFFPFEDNIEIANEYGVKTIVQPGGSIRDKQVIAKCDEYNITMILTGTRHFKH